MADECFKWARDASPTCRDVRPKVDIRRVGESLGLTWRPKLKDNETDRRLIVFAEGGLTNLGAAIPIPRSPLAA